MYLLAYLPEGSEHFADYIEAVSWAQAYAAQNRETMLRLILAALRRHLPPFEVTSEAVNYHHNYEPVKKPHRNRKYSAWVGYNCVDRVISGVGKHDKRDRR